MNSSISLMIVWAIIIIFFITVAGFIILRFIKSSNAEKEQLTDKFISKLSEKEPIWDKAGMVSVVKDTYEVLKKSYDKRKSDVQPDVMTINIYRELFNKVVPNLEKLSFIEFADIKEIEIIQIRDHRDETRKSFSVKISLSGQLPPDEPPFIYWTFVYVNKKWLLSDISKETIKKGYYFG